mmetsp:Transcript_118129/g.329384  ORF Transcript_118129/g.329384 Transcript_118129/m.329384 type:complete len:551 (+) Transcript_118129:27-1679(+)|eukprot:CAMPEP_0179113680 /NCGR_PEP_ID=MMETSP0796-20121207/53197_1 /TAXON_ID=73915 /ORGANISM="Pyrodinium bahamense, Strain pbaha01" /LENGTH=550 /DNA_ID=CAMNT_0020811883 /DNA_START=25 /DNA_END=1677 /DNA_ORIENTATION=-
MGGRDTLEWSADIQHVAVAQLRARLKVCLGGMKPVGTLNQKLNLDVWPIRAKMLLEVFADGNSPPGVGEVAYCRGDLRPKERSVCVLWLGSSSKQPAHESVRGWRCIQSVGVDGRHEGTVAEAMLGSLAGVALLFGITTMKLQPKDSGSGRLVSYYVRLGFKAMSRVGGNWMEAPTKAVASLSPASWLHRLVPAGFHAQPWLHGVAVGLHLYRVFGSEPVVWSWKVAYPSGAWAKAEFGVADVQQSGCADVRAAVVEDGVEIVSAQGSVQLEQGRLSISWLGVHPEHSYLRGQLAYYTLSRGQDGADDAPQSNGQVTIAVGILGVLAILGRWICSVIVELQALDDGSGRLIRYFRDLGFNAPAVKQGGKKRAAKQPCLEMPCDALARAACPLGWYSKLPAPGQISLAAVLGQASAYPKPHDEAPAAPLEPGKAPAGDAASHLVGHSGLAARLRVMVKPLSCFGPAECRYLCGPALTPMQSFPSAQRGSKDQDDPLHSKIRPSSSSGPRRATPPLPPLDAPPLLDVPDRPQQAESESSVGCCSLPTMKQPT